MLSLQGLKFPWESAVSGREVCPEDIYGQQEIHINGDVTLAFQHYLYLTEVRSLIPTHCHSVSFSLLYKNTLCDDLFVAGSVHVHRGQGQGGDIRGG